MKRIFSPAFQFYLGTILLVALIALSLIVAGPVLAAKGGGGGGGKPSDGGGGGGGGGGKGGGKNNTPAVRVEGAGDSIMRGYNADCTRNTGLFDFLCYGGGDQPENSFLDGTNSAVLSIVDRYVALDSRATGGKAASESGSEMRDPGKNNFATQATAIVSAASQPVKVVVELGGNDICNRTSDTDMYTDAQWQESVDAGLDVLVNGLPDGSTVYLSSVPRVQDLRGVGIAKQTGNSRVNCESFWATYDVCSVATASDTYFDAISERQQSYNEILAARALDYNAQAATTGVEVTAEYAGDSSLSVGTYAFTTNDMNGGDCFHPSVAGQNKLSEILWGNNPYQ